MIIVAGTIRIPVDKSVVQTYDASPYMVLLATRIASASVSNGMTDSTGPKISSRAIRISDVTSAKTVGRTK